MTAPKTKVANYSQCNYSRSQRNKIDVIKQLSITTHVVIELLVLWRFQCTYTQKLGELNLMYINLFFVYNVPPCLTIFQFQFNTNCGRAFFMRSIISHIYTNTHCVAIFYTSKKARAFIAFLLVIKFALALTYTRWFFPRLAIVSCLIFRHTAYIDFRLLVLPIRHK